MENESTKSMLTWLQNGITHSVTIKIIVITIIILLLLIPTTMIESLIHEREHYKNTATQEVRQKWGEGQIISGPFITVPYQQVHTDKEGLITYSTHYAHFLPEQLNVASQVAPIIRKRGIYQIPLYNGKLHITGQFKKPDFSIWNMDPQLVMWDDAHLSVGISDLSGIQERIKVNWNGRSLDIAPGLVNHDVVNTGVNCTIPITEANSYTFDFNLNLNGSETLGITPLGKQTTVSMSSSWANPGFGGKFLPDNHNITNDGFNASWTVLDLNRNYPQQWLANKQSIEGSTLGVNFLLPVDEYQKNIRSIKYSVLIIALTFLIFFLVEVMNSKRFHPIQYALVGLAISLFYVLLVSITEQFGFNAGYAVASFLIITLISIYIRAIFNSNWLTGVASGSLILIYFFIYIVLQLQDYSLLVGSLGLFIALSILMLLTRKINWYSLSVKPKSAA